MQKEVIVLSPGQRLALGEEARAYQLQRGSCELYAINQFTKLSFFLRELAAGDIIFPLPEGDLIFQVYCKAEAELSSLQAEDLSLEEWRERARRYFAAWQQAGSARLDVHRAPEELGSWFSPDFLRDKGTAEELWAEIGAQQQLCQSWLEDAFRLKAQQKYSRVWGLEDQQQRLLSQSIGNLLQEELPVEAASEEGLELSLENDRLEECTFLVRTVATRLEMPADNIRLAARLAGRLDQAGLLKRLMQKGNMNMRLVTLDDDWYKKDCGTLLGYYGPEKRLVALLPLATDSYRLVSMEQPEGIPVDAAVAAEIDKDGFQCYPGFPARRLTVKDVAKFMFTHCWKRDYLTILLCSLVAGIIPLVSPIITETVFSDIIPINDHQSLAAVTQIMLLTGFATATLGLVRSIAVLRITNHLDMTVEGALWGRLLQLPVKFFRRFESGELLQRMQGIETIKGLVTGQFVGQIFNFVFSFWSLFLMLYYSWKLTAEALLVWFFYFIFVALVYRQLISWQKEMVKATNEAAGLVQQIFSGLAKFRVHGSELQAYNLWTKVFGQEWKWTMKLRWQGNYSGLIGSVQPFVLNMLLYYTAVYGMSEANEAGQMVKTMSYAEFMAFSSAFSAFNATVVGIVPLVAQFFTMKPYIDNLRPILDEVPEITEDKVDADILTGAVKVEGLSFSYGEDLPEVLHDISFELKPGENVAIVGPSGCGKSTLLRLLLGMEEPTRGCIYYDYQDLQELSLASVRSQLGVVLQSGQLMTGSIYENIVGTSPLTIEDAWEAAEKAGIAKDIREMPMDMHTVISEGSGNISGGQKQRLLIARAIVGRPAIVVLDEATSALDNRTQAIVTESLNNMKATRIVVAHRLSTIREADRILVLEAGRLIEEGSFEELVARGGLFASLAKRQMV